MGPVSELCDKSSEAATGKTTQDTAAIGLNLYLSGVIKMLNQWNRN